MNGLQPLMELTEHYRGVLRIDLILDLISILILTLLTVQFVKRKHRTLELTLFFIMCITDMLMALSAMAFDIIPLFIKAPGEAIKTLQFNWFMVGIFVDQIFSLTLIALWLIYVEYTLHQSRDLIRRRYPAALIPFAAAVVMIFADIFVILFWSDPPVEKLLLDTALYLLSYGILVFYLVAAYVVLYLEKKRNRVPAYIRLTPTTICILAGYGINLILPDNFYPVLSPCFALGLLFADHYMYRRLSYIDPKTGFYNKKYLSELINIAKKKHYTGATVIRFKVQRGSDVMTALLKAWNPEQCKAIIIGDGVFLLVSEAVKDSVSERFIALLREQLKDKGIPAEADYETDKKGPVDILLRKYT